MTDTMCRMLRFSVYLMCIAIVVGAGYALSWSGFSVFSAASVVSPASSQSRQPISEPIQITTPHRCDSRVSLYAPQDVSFCENIPKLDRFRLFEVNLSKNRILFYEQGLLVRTFPIAYQAAYGKWFQTPTGYFRLGVKKEKFKSSIVPVYMEYGVQLYEDFFIHGIPYYEDGTRVTSQFSGGCIRLEDDIARSFYNTAQRGDEVVSYLTLDEYPIRDGFVSPIDQGSFWIRQRFNSPLKVEWGWNKEIEENYIQHTGLDLSPMPQAHDRFVRAITDGVVEKIVLNGAQDRGLGNTVIVSHRIGGTILYALYAHLDSIHSELKEGALVSSGAHIGIVGNTGYGCNWWRVGDDGCDAIGEPDTHLHLEIKTKPVLGSPYADPNCAISKEVRSCVGSTSADPVLFGYLDPLEVVFNIQHSE